MQCLGVTRESAPKTSPSVFLSVRCRVTRASGSNPVVTIAVPTFRILGRRCYVNKQDLTSLYANVSANAIIDGNAILHAHIYAVFFLAGSDREQRYGGHEGNPLHEAVVLP